MYRIQQCFKIINGGMENKQQIFATYRVCETTNQVEVVKSTDPKIYVSSIAIVLVYSIVGKRGLKSQCKAILTI